MKDEKIFTGKLPVETREKETDKEISENDNRYIPDWCATITHFSEEP